VDDFTVPPLGPERVRFAEETHRMACDLFDPIPFHLIRWRRQAKIVRARIAALRAANEAARLSRG
jgi:hypothetical protein